MENYEQQEAVELKTAYKNRFEHCLYKLAQEIERDLTNILRGLPNIDRVSARAKGVDRFVKKAMKTVDGGRKYAEPLKEIQDQIGARVTTLYKEDVVRVRDQVLAQYSQIEEQYKTPEDNYKFGYEGIHFILLVPPDLKPEIEDDLCPKFFELQIKTLFQHAWSESSHDLVYKAPRELTDDQHRRVALTAAQAWGADMIIGELYTELAK